MPSRPIAEIAQQLANIGTEAARNRKVLPPTRFIILTPGRAGSKFLIELLSSHPNVKCDFELLRKRVNGPMLHLLVAGARVRNGWW